MEYTLDPPTAEQVQAGRDRFLSRYLLPQGITLVHGQDGAVYERAYPSQDELTAARAYWLGGHRHILTQEQRNLLVGAGYGSCITPDTSGYGGGEYGMQPYGT